jgi:DNA-3-methyladenine glycosylase I
MLFELLILEGAQAGLSWSTILKKRAGYREAFAGFDPRRVADFDQAKVAALLNNPAVIRNRLKIQSAVANAQAFLRIQAEFDSFSSYLWAFVDSRPVVNRRSRGESLPAKTSLSDRISRDLQQRGFKFVGSVIIYSFLQATGVVDDHFADCFRAKQAIQPKA